MSRSFNKHPVMGMTTARSEKYDKRLANRRWRRGERLRIIAMRDPDQFVLFPQDSYSNVWSMDKDGRQRFSAIEHPEWLRK